MGSDKASWRISIGLTIEAPWASHFILRIPKFIPLLGDKTIQQSTDGRMSFDKGNYGLPIRNDPDVRSIFYDTVRYRRIKTHFFLVQ